MAEFEATAPFSIHLERPKGGFINMLQRSVDSGTFVAVKNFNPNYNATQVIDADCGQGAVYPKWIRIESAVEPSVAEVTFESESSGGGAGTESTMEYLDVSGVTMESFMQDNLLNAGYFANIEVEQMGRIRAVPTMYSQGITPQKVYSVAIDLNHGYVAQGQELTGRNAMINGGWTNEQIDSLPRLTADEFYKWALEA